MGGLALALALPFVGALALNILCQRRSQAAGWIASAVAVACLVLVAAAMPSHLGEAQQAAWGWMPALGVELALRADALALLFALLITAIGTVVFTYAAAYLGPQENRRRFFAYLLTFMGAMLGIVLSANLIGLFVFWELTSVSSFLLIGFWHTRERSRSGALKALVITSAGGLAMFVGFLMIGIVCESFDIGEIIQRRHLLAASPWANAATILVILGAITKSAQLPFHLWLPSAMEAPTPVSAYLHAATMVKAGIYLVARMGPALAPVPLWTSTLTVIGLATMAWGSWMALRQTDLKALLAFSTVSQLGLILTLLAPAEASASAAGLLHLINHASFKGALFLLVGVVEHQAHSRDIRRLGALWHSMPKTCVLMVVAALSMAGLPPLGGFISKEMFLEHVLGLGWPLATLSVVGATATAAYSMALAFGVARGRGQAYAQAAQARDPSLALLWGPALLVLATVVLGLIPTPLVGDLLTAAADVCTAGRVTELHLALWHGLGPSLIASVIILVSGAGVYALWWQRYTPPSPTLVTDRIYNAFLDSLQRGSAAITAAYMSGLLWRYVAFIYALLVAALVAAAASGNTALAASWNARPAQDFEVVVSLAALAAAIAAAAATTRLASILALSANGYLLALIFSSLGAPDLALTQVMVETISVVLFLAVFVFLPHYPQPPKRRRLRPFHLALSVATGALVAALLFLARGHRVAESISRFFVDSSLEKAGGGNVVNVILVDFRGLDTMGEITVLGLAALACFAIIKLGTKEDSA